MDPSRAPLSPAGSTKRRRTPPQNEYGIPSAHPSQTSLPSFKQLEPYLRPQHMPSDYPYTGTSLYAPHTGQQQQQESATSSQIMGTPQRDSAFYGAGDSEPDELEVDHHNPPKKKRRRQALSCTECKRRKIKCDRSQPCTPCTRRGEEAGCQWHIVEPVEKYATKAEFDELKTRFDQLAALVQRFLPPASTGSVPYYSMGPMSGVISSEAVPGYNPGASSSIANVYSSLMPPPAPTSQPYSSQLLDTSSSSSRFSRLEETAPSSSTRIHQSALGSSSSPILSTSLHSPSLARHRDITSSSSVVRSSPLSLASITSPYHPDPQQQQSHSQFQSQPKNCHAQTLILGERLRRGSEGLVVSQMRHKRTYSWIVPCRRRGLLHLRLQFHLNSNKEGLPIGWQVVVILAHPLHGVRTESD